jgi:urea carboxylase
MQRRQLPPTRYDYGGDEFVFVELAQEMSLEVNFKAMAITHQLQEKNLPGIIDICPSNASYLIRLNPDELDPHDLIAELKEIEKNVGDMHNFDLRTRVIDVPVMYQDPWTHETLMRFRDRHQNPGGTDLEYAARVNGYKTTEDFIAAHSGSPYFVTMVGFVPGLPWCYQMVPREEQIEVPKYLRPRTDTPERALGHGGCFAVIYPVRGAGGYQLFGIAPAPIFDPNHKLPDFAEAIVFPRPGDIFKYRRIDRDEFDRLRAEVEQGTFRYRWKDIDFYPDKFFSNPKKYNEEILGVLYSD